MPGDDSDDTPAMTVRSRDFSIAAMPCPGEPLTPENDKDDDYGGHDDKCNSDSCNYDL